MLYVLITMKTLILLLNLSILSLLHIVKSGFNLPLP